MLGNTTYWPNDLKGTLGVRQYLFSIHESIFVLDKVLRYQANIFVSFSAILTHRFGQIHTTVSIQLFGVALLDAPVP